MTQPPPPQSVIHAHLALCSELHELLLEENRVLRTTGGTSPEDLLERKKQFLPRLDESLKRLREITSGSVRLDEEARAAVVEGRKRLMQLLMLDRENERLLLKAALPAPLKAAYAPVIPGQVARAYRKHTEASSKISDA